MKPHLRALPRHTRVPEKPVRHVPVVVLAKSECLTVVSSEGQPLLEISYNDNGPSIRLAQDSLRLECPGTLDLAAKNIMLQASEDVTVQGQTIRLN